MRVTDEWLEDYQRRQGGKKIPLTQALDTIAALSSQPKQSKYRNKKCTYGGAQFDSKGERDRWIVLTARLQSGEISDLRRQVPFEVIPPVVLDGRRTAATIYRADFTYIENGVPIVEDFKGHKTAEYRIKRKLMKHVLGIEVKETGTAKGTRQK